MRKILIVTPNLSTGGTNSSLSNLYEVLKDVYDIEVFAMSHHGHALGTFKEKLLREYKILSLWNSVYIELESPFDRVFSICIKTLKRLSIRLGLHTEERLYKRILRKLHSSEYDCIIGFQEGSATKFVSLSDCTRKLAWVHCDYSNWHPVIKQEEREAYRRIDQVVCVSKYTSSVFNTIFKLPNPSISINNFQDIATIKRLANSQIDEASWDASSYKIISVGRINPVKRFREIPEIANQLKKTGYKFKWYIIGPEFSAEEMQKIRDGIEKYKLSDRVIYMGAKTNPYPYFANADLYVCLSESEACPMVFNEAKCFGTPVVTTDFGSSYEFVTSTNEGMIVAREKLADTIATFISVGHTSHIPSDVVERNNQNIKSQLINILGAK